MKAVLANGADVNERTGGGQTPLILATIFGHTHLIPLLLDAGADPQLRDNLGLNAIDWAQRRGATEVIDLLSNTSARTAGTRPATRPETTQRRSTEPVDEKSAAASDEERSRRWIAGLKQRIAEQSQREVPDGPNIFRPQATPLFESQQQPASQQSDAVQPHDVSFESQAPLDSESSLESQPWLASTEREPEPEIPIEPTPQPELPSTPPAPQPEIPAPPPDPQHDLPAQPQQPEPESPAQPPEPEVVAAYQQASSETASSETATSSQEAPETTRRSRRKRCPKCNAIYNSDLIAYCAHHIVPLVDDDEPPVISPPQATSPVLFWMIIIGTLIVSVIGGSFVAAFFYNSNRSQPAVTASQPTQGNIQKGTPAVSKELEDKVLSLPIAECPLNGQVPIPGTVTVRVTINRSGQVTEARASGGDWLLRGAATEAAMKSTFAPEKLRGRVTEGTITYTFGP